MTLELNEVFFLILLPIISFLYASVGHGGASGYLALMALFSFPNEMMKQTALLLNLIVAGIAFTQYYRAGHFNKNLFLYFAIGSIPMAFIGGQWALDPAIYKKILGVFLFFAVLRMLFSTPKSLKNPNSIKPLLAILLGAGIGLFSGLIGIGGGIILTPIILLLHYGNMKEAAAVSALFIWVNSASGLLGQWSSGIEFPPLTLLMVVVALIGGNIGSYYGSKRWNTKKLEYFLAIVLTTAGIKLILF